MIIDLQVGLESEDGSVVDPEALAAGAKAAGLDGIVVTQNDVLFPPKVDLASAAEKHGVTVFTGARIATNHGLLLCLLPDPSVKPSWQKGEDGLYEAAAVIDALDELGGVAIALRPYDRGIDKPMGDHIFALQGLAACDVQNGRVGGNANSLALEAASNLEMPCVGTSSASGTKGLGTSATLFRGPVKSEAELVEAIRHGECWPISFSTDVPAAEPVRAPRRGGERGERGGRRDSRNGGRGRRRGGFGGGRGRPAGAGGPPGGGGGGAPGGGGGPQARQERSDRGGERTDGGEAGRRRRRRGGRRRGGRPVEENAGNRVDSPRRSDRDEDFGNRRFDDQDRLPSEDIGNRLRPGEEPLFRPPQTVRDEDDDEGGGNP